MLSLRKVIEVWHREGTLVYAWLELPREKTAALQESVFDWRKLMNLTNRDCFNFNAAAEGVRKLLDRFDWDGVEPRRAVFRITGGDQQPVPVHADE